MRQEPNETRFWYYVLPSMLTMLLSGFYAIVDGFFVGQATGDIGLGAINLAWPIAALLQASGIGVGVGGSVLMSLYSGGGDPKKAASVRGCTILTLAVFSALLMGGFFLGYPAVLRAFGAQGELLAAAESYIRMVLFGTFFQVFGCGLTPLLKNSRRAVLAMFIMVSGLAANIALDALFVMVFGWGISGAGAATVAAQGVVALFSLIALCTDRHLPIRLSDFRPDVRLMLHTLKIGLSPFGVAMAPSIVIIFTNWQCIRYGGDTAVAAYSVLSYISTTFLCLLQGIGDGAQPIVSFLYGAARFEEMERVRRRMFRLALILGCAFLLISLPTTGFFTELFGVSKDAGDMARTGLILTALAYPFAGIVRNAISYFYAVDNTRLSTFFVYADPLLFTPLFLLILPPAFCVNGIWTVLAAVQFSLCILILIALFRTKKAETDEKKT